MAERHYDKRFDEMSESELLEAVSSEWVMNPARARKERYAVGVGGRGAAGETRYVIALQIEDVLLVKKGEPGSHLDDRYKIVGKVLGPGHPVHEAYVGKPAEATRNPIRYEPSEFDLTPCRCGCGQAARSAFLPGHDQRAIHDRVARFGTVAKFIDWFDQNYPVANPNPGHAEGQGAGR